MLAVSLKGLFRLLTIVLIVRRITSNHTMSIYYGLTASV